MAFADPNFEDLRSQSHSLRGAAEYSTRLRSVSVGPEPTRTNVAYVSRDFFSVMGMQPVLGRGFSAEDQHFGGAPVALVSYRYWRQHLAGTTDLSASKLKVENQFCSVLGVLPDRFQFPFDADVWIPRELSQRLPSRSAHNWRVVARLSDEVSLPQARAELSGIARRLKQQYGQDTMMTDVAVLPLRNALTNQVRPALLVLLGAGVFLLLVASANVVNLLLAQATAREKELAIRSAIGAGRSRLLQQSLTEALVLSVIGGILGVFAAFWELNVLLAIAPRNLPRLEDVSINLSVLLFAFTISVIVAVAMGIFVAVRATYRDVQGALIERGQAYRGMLSGNRVGGIIVGAQLATTLILLVGAGLLGRSLLHVLSVDPGFRTEHVITIDLALPFAYKDADKVPRVQFLNELLGRLRAIPGVQEVGGTGRLPLTAPLSDGTYIVVNSGNKLSRTMQDIERLGFERLVHDPSMRKASARYCPVSEGYFHAIGIPLLRGRLFNDHDTLEAPHVAVISESLARETWANQDPLGQTIEFGNMDGDLRLLTVVGIVGDVRTDNLETSAPPTIYVNYRQRPQATGRFAAVLRTDQELSAVIPAAREIIRNLDPDIPPSFSTLTQVVEASLHSRRFNLMIVGAFASTALLLAVTGIYGLMGYSVARRTHEFGVRLAVGASPADILRLVLGQGVITITIAVAIGACGSVALTRTMQSLLFGVTAADPATFVGGAVLLTLAALLGCYFPARRATRVDPLVALRYE
jgi:predicted permease